MNHELNQENFDKLCECIDELVEVVEIRGRGIEMLINIITDHRAVIKNLQERVAELEANKCTYNNN